MIVFALVFEWCLGKVDFAFAYTQAPIAIAMEIYMDLPDGIEPKSDSKANHVLKLLSNLCGKKQAGQVKSVFGGQAT